MTKEEALNIAIDYMNERLEEHDAKFQRHPVAEAERNNILADIEAVKEALAQPEQEPVATDWERIARVQDAKLRAMCNEAGGFEKLCEVMDKYERTTLPQRKPLTDEDIEAMWPLRPTDEIVAFARAIEAAHGIGCETTLVKGEA